MLSCLDRESVFISEIKIRACTTQRHCSCGAGSRYFWLILGLGCCSAHCIYDQSSYGVGIDVGVRAPILEVAGVPLGGLGLLLGIDRIPDMFRSATNITGHVAAAVTVEGVVGHGPDRKEPRPTEPSRK